MCITYRKACHKDIDVLIKMRLEYLTEDKGGLTDSEEKAITSQLNYYFSRQIDGDFIAYVAEADGKCIASVYMSVAEKPANTGFVTGKVGTILNVFTYAEYRRKGIATRLLNMMIDEAKKMDLSFLDLSATDDGKPVYEKLGFKTEQSGYTKMKLQLV